MHGTAARVYTQVRAAIPRRTMWSSIAAENNEHVSNVANRTFMFRFGDPDRAQSIDRAVQPKGHRRPTVAAFTAPERTNIW